MLVFIGVLAYACEFCLEDGSPCMMGLFIPTFIFDGIGLLPDFKKMRVFIKVEF
jgi:hypothetical protein